MKMVNSIEYNDNNSLKESKKLNDIYFLNMISWMYKKDNNSISKEELNLLNRFIQSIITYFDDLDAFFSMEYIDFIKKTMKLMYESLDNEDEIQNKTQKNIENVLNKI